MTGFLHSSLNGCMFCLVLLGSCASVCEDLSSVPGNGVAGGNAMMSRSGLDVARQIFNVGVVPEAGFMLLDAFVDGYVGLASVEGRTVVARDFVYGVR